MDSNTQLRNEDPAPYSVTPINTKAAKAASDDQIIAQAIAILGKRLKVAGEMFGSPTAVKQYCQLKLGGLEHEEFGVLFLDVQNRLIKFEPMFRGTITQTSVYPREVVKACIANNCAAVVLTHNHPSGSTQPSRADEYLTQTLKAALSLIDVRILDHVIVSSTDTLSMAERGLI